MFADEFVGRQTLGGFEPAAEVVGIDKVGKVLPQLRVIVIVEALDGGVLEGPVHPLDLSIGSRMLDLGEAMFDTMFLANSAEDVLESL